MEGNTSAAMFYLKTQAGWRETQHIDHTSSDGTMSPKSAKAMTNEEIEAELEALGVKT
jgi:hypothetical protein